MGLLEQHMETMEGTLTRLAETTEFHRDLRSGAHAPAQLPGAAPPAASSGPVVPPGHSRP
jgi:hypothetical protein